MRYSSNYTLFLDYLTIISLSSSSRLYCMGEEEETLIYDTPPTLIIGNNANFQPTSKPIPCTFFLLLAVFPFPNYPITLAVCQNVFITYFNP